MNRKVHAGFGPADGSSTIRKLVASIPSDWHTRTQLTTYPQRLLLLLLLLLLLPLRFALLFWWVDPNCLR